MSFSPRPGNFAHSLPLAISLGRRCGGNESEDLPNRYELCTLLRRLAHDHRKCILFSTHELDIALSLCDSIALIDPPVLRYLPTPDMACSGYIERLFSNSFVTFDTESGTIKVRK